MKHALGEKEIIAEDHGNVTECVRQVVRDSGYPGMKVLEFAFDSRDSGSASDYLPHNYPENSVVYTGTHDNETILGWLDSISREDYRMAREYLCDFHTPKKELPLAFISLVMRSNARMCIIPVQDYLGLDNTARMNVPSTVGTNWKWRVTKKQLDDHLFKLIGDVTKRYGRWNWL